MILEECPSCEGSGRDKNNEEQACPTCKGNGSLPSDDYKVYLEVEGPPPRAISWGLVMFVISFGSMIAMLLSL